MLANSWEVIGYGAGRHTVLPKDVFFGLGGYDESLYMGEDVDFYWRLKRFAKRRNGRVRVANWPVLKLLAIIRSEL